MMKNTKATVHGISVTMRKSSIRDEVELVTEAGQQLGAINVRTGEETNCDGTFPADPQMLTDAKRVYGSVLPTTEETARAAKRGDLRYCDHCEQPAIGRSNIGGWACATHYDEFS